VNGKWTFCAFGRSEAKVEAFIQMVLKWRLNSVYFSADGYNLRLLLLYKAVSDAGITCKGAAFAGKPAGNI
jgi:hypothetical protein